MGGNEGRGGERWNFFGTRSVVQKSPTDPGSDTSTGERYIPTPASGFWLCCNFDGIDSPGSRLNSVLRQTTSRPLLFVFPLNTIVLVQLPLMNWLHMNSSLSQWEFCQRQHAMFNPQAAIQM